MSASLNSMLLSGESGYGTAQRPACRRQPVLSAATRGTPRDRRRRTALFSFRHLLGRGSASPYGTRPAGSTAPNQTLVTVCYLDMALGERFRGRRRARFQGLPRSDDLVAVCHLFEGGRSTANSSVTSRRGERKRNTAAGRPPARPGARPS